MTLCNRKTFRDCESIAPGRTETGANVSDIMLIIHAAYNHGTQQKIRDLCYFHLAAKVLTQIVPKDDEALGKQYFQAARIRNRSRIE